MIARNPKKNYHIKTVVKITIEISFSFRVLVQVTGLHMKGNFRGILDETVIKSLSNDFKETSM